MTGRLQGCRALVTGGPGGIGMAIGEVFLREGAELWMADLYDEGDSPVRAALGHLYGASYLQLDVTDAAAWKAAADTLGERLDVLINNAGIAPTGEIGTFSEATWQQVMAVNSTSAYLSLTHLAPLLAAAGQGDRWASVVNLSSILANVGMGQAAGYAASKEALRNLSKSVAVEFTLQLVNLGILAHIVRRYLRQLPLPGIPRMLTEAELLGNLHRIPEFGDLGHRITPKLIAQIRLPIFASCPPT